MLRRFTLALLLGLISLASLAADRPVFSTERGAIDGYDPVAMLRDGEARRGDARYTMAWSGATWSFASEANRDRFAADPERFAPQYGGHCAVGATHGGLVPSDPTTFSVSDGKLYLNLGPEQRQTWTHLQERMQPRADAGWAKRLAEIEHGAPPAAGGFGQRAPNAFALDGLDAISYFENAAPIAGSDDYTSDFDGARYRFASLAHKSQFEADPVRYLPQYRGSCALVTAHDFTLPADPSVHVVHRGKLYLFLGATVRETFLGDPDWFIARADAHFRKQQQSPAAKP